MDNLIIFQNGRHENTIQMVTGLECSIMECYSEGLLLSKIVGRGQQ